MKPLQLFLILAAGVLFGVGLALSGMTDPARVIGFLDVFGAWDPTLVFVMAGAVGSYGLGRLLWSRRTGGQGWWGTRLPGSDKEPGDRALVAGAVIFGFGWGLSGFCPGPALANLGRLEADALVFVPAMVVGMAVARRIFGAT